MATFELTGPDGASYQVEAPDQNAALAAFSSFQGKPPAAKEGITADNLVRSFGHGFPLVGGVLDNVAATMDAATQPVLGRGSEAGTYAERKAANLAAEEAKTKGFAKEHPVVDTLANVAGGVTSLGGVIGSVPGAATVLGARGTLPQMIKMGGASGAALSAADDAIRGGDPEHGAIIGGVLGMGGPIAGRVIGKGVAAFKGRNAPPVQAHTANVGDVEVPLTSGQATGDAAAANQEELARRGILGTKAEEIARAADAERMAAVRQAEEGVAAGMDPSGTVPATAPKDAGAMVADELAHAEQTRFQTEQARAARAQADTAAIGDDLRGGAAAVDSPMAAAERLSGDLAQQEAQRAAAETQRLADAGASGNRTARSLSPTGELHADSPYVAGEAVSGGVIRARDAAVADRNARYAAVRNEPGTFDPSVPRGLAEDIRARLNRGDDPLWVDPTTTSTANTALNLIDQTVGKGIFRNAAAGRGAVGPVAEAAAGGTDAERVLAQLTAQGVNPERARAAVANLPGGQALAGGSLAPHSVAVPGGGSVDVAPKVVEASSLLTSADKGYDKGLQPRNRARAASDAQIADISGNLNPSRLGASSEADRGAPIVGADNMVESGNGRVLAIRKAYQDGGQSAESYREWLKAQGVDVSKYKEPVLVRERTTPMTKAEREAFTVGANRSSTLSLSASEKALSDARALTPESLDLIRNPGDLGSGENMDFVRKFVSNLPQAEQGAMMAADGTLSSEGLTRVRNAVLGKAYGDTPILARIAESTTDDVKSISNALVSAAPEWARLRVAVKSGAVPKELDITPDLLDAVQRTAQIRGKGVGLGDSLAQADAFTKQSPESEAIQRMFYAADGERAASAASVSDRLRYYAQEAAKVDAAPGLDFGMQPVTALDILKGASKKFDVPNQLAAGVISKAEAAAQPAAPEVPDPVVGLKEMDSARKRLVKMYSDARGAAKMNPAAKADAEAMQRILREFDSSIIDAFESGKFTGDSAQAQRLLQEARASHSAYRETFTPRGPGDEIGRDVEKILGRYVDSAMTPGDVAKLSYGPENNPGGGKSIKVNQRLRGILGETSPEWGAQKQGLFDYVKGNNGSRSPTEMADRIDNFLTGTNGRGLAQVMFSPEERTALARHAVELRAAEPEALSSLRGVDKIVARLSGRDGGVPPSPADAANYLFGRQGSAARGETIQIAQRLKSQFGADSDQWKTYQTGAFKSLMEDSKADPAKAASLIDKYLGDTALAKVVFTDAQRAKLAGHADVLREAAPRVESLDDVGREIQRIASGERVPDEIMIRIMGKDGKGTPFGARLIDGLRPKISPEALVNLKQDMFKRVISPAAEGMTPHGYQALSQRMHYFLDSDLAKGAYSAKELDKMKQLATLYKQIAPVPGATNPSGSTPMLVRAAKGMSSMIMGMIGLSHGGLPGLAMGVGAAKAAGVIANRRGAREASALFLGPRKAPPTDPRFAKAAALLFQGAGPGQINGR